MAGVSLAAMANEMVAASGVRGCRATNRVSSYGHGCRCVACTAAIREYYRLKRDRVKREGLPPWQRHGENSSYVAGCRCNDCRTAHNVDRAARAQLKREGAS